MWRREFRDKIASKVIKVAKEATGARILERSKWDSILFELNYSLN